MVPFNFNRCMRLVGDLMFENKKSLLMLWGIPILALTLLIVEMGVVFGGYTHKPYEYGPSEDWNYGFNMFIMVATFISMGCIVASRGLSNTRDKQRAISSLMLPVSEKERYIARFIVYVPMYTLALVVGMVLVELMRFGILSAIYPHAAYLKLVNPAESFDKEAFWCITFIFIGVQSFFFLSGAIWPKIGMVFAFVFFVVIFLLNIILMSIVFSSGSIGYEYMPAKMFKDWDNDDMERFFVILSNIFCAISCGINYILAYFRCKEREIINRW